MSLSARVVIIGAGLTGLSAAYRLRNEDYMILECKNRIGGLADTDEFEGFLFDRGSHVWFTGDKRVDRFVRRLPGVSMRLHKRSAWVHIYGKLIPAPFQGNVFGLPLEVVSECLSGYVEAKQQRPEKIGSLGDWLQTTFGSGVYKHFMYPYNKKVWTVDPAELAFDWNEGRIDRPATKDLIDGAIGLRRNNLGANSEFCYPKGGVKSLSLSMLQNPSRILYNTSAIEIDLSSRTILTKNGQSIKFERLISTMPLPTLVHSLKDPTAEALLASDQLRYTQVLLVNIALKKRPQHDYHWIYFSEPQFPFFRVSFPHDYSPSMCPQGMGSIQAECAFQSCVAVDANQVAEESVRRLEDSGYLESSNVQFVRTHLLNPAYVIQDHKRQGNVNALMQYLSAAGICSCGRFGGWQYINMDGCISAGFRAADSILCKSRNDD